MIFRLRVEPSTDEAAIAFNKLLRNRFQEAIFISISGRTSISFFERLVEQNHSNLLQQYPH
ncbi:hypothetical protein [Trichocoleus sp. FACHB-262]|uniref:hypothetical protein n=1 Tax=Trichocoleus sp. FACHB-262 TaxID=2692869 RepID=UPI00168383F6|nr:hypothetical protein [Trichocoleus sp. FACHB-262]MBD2124204.1 hypothetical protein [Trichocoleus sp. FACHB-262]